MEALKYVCIPLMILVTGCVAEDQAAPAPDEGIVSQRGAALKVITQSDTMAYPPTQGHLPPIPEPVAVDSTTSSRVLTDSCPQQKASRADWKELALSKARLKEEALRGVEEPVYVQPPPAELLERQAHFLEVVKNERFDQLTLEAREAAYSAFKRSILGE